ncbi:hypothetical protein ACPB9J_10260 [Streptomyces lavendulocolor]|uniref:hypothetical protein n=1 Tax=Streptomyces lavendulocolor TaxID=67316 RepID=UPI003C30CFC7
MDEQGPLRPQEAWPGVAACFLATPALLVRGLVHLPEERLGTRIRFADGTSAPVYRETRLGSGLARDPCTLVVAFRLLLVGGAGHTAFRKESLLNTPLFVGFPGFASKLWLAHDERDRYRGVYEWDGPGRAERYARSLWRVLALVSEPGSIRYTVLPGLRRDDFLAGTGGRGTDTWPGAGPGRDGSEEWWRVQDTP